MLNEDDVTFLLLADTTFSRKKAQGRQQRLFPRKAGITRYSRKKKHHPQAYSRKKVEQKTAHSQYQSRSATFMADLFSMVLKNTPHK